MSRKLLLGTVLLSAAILAIVFSMSWSESGAYSRSVSDFHAHPIYDRVVRVQGTLVPGSLCYRDNPCEYRFRLEDQRYAPTDAGMSAASPQLSVRYPQCVVPDTFRPGSGIDVSVTVEGKLCANCHQFEASALYAKMPGKYEMKMRDGAVEATPQPLKAVGVCPDS